MASLRKKMAHRQFRDEDGRAWEVWDVRPSRMVASETADITMPGQRPRHGTLLNLPSELTGGWLAFKTDGESRRLAPIPASWAALADQDLARLAREAKPISRISPRL